MESRPLIYDRNYNLLDFTYSQLTATGAMNASYTAKEGGYAYLYVSNEHPTQVDVYFDDISMSYTPSRIIQSNEYYPFGAQTARSWTRETAAPNNFLGNGGTELNLTSSLYDLDYRNYDPILGRLNQVDPMSNKYGGLSPYHFSFNNPVTWNDPTGADTFDGANIPKGPYEAGTPWSHNWFTGRPANQEGHAEVATRLFWQMVADAREARYGGGSMQEYGFKYGQLMDLETGKEMVRSYQEYYRMLQNLLKFSPIGIDPDKVTASLKKGIIPDNRVVEFLKSNFGNAYKKYGDKIHWVYEEDPTSETNVTNGATNPGATVRRGGKVTVYINSYAFSDPDWAYLVIGHEFVHADLYLSGQYDKWGLKYDYPMASFISEFYAYAWQSRASYLLGFDDHGGTRRMDDLVPFLPMSALIEYSKK